MSVVDDREKQQYSKLYKRGFCHEREKSSRFTRPPKNSYLKIRLDAR